MQKNAGNSQILRIQSCILLCYIGMADYMRLTSRSQYEHLFPAPGRHGAVYSFNIPVLS